MLLAIASFVACSTTPPPPATETIVVATRDLPPGTRVAAGDLAAIEAPIGVFPSQVARRTSEAIDQRVRFEIRANEPVRGDALLSAARLPSTLGAAVPPGLRAVEIPVVDPVPLPGHLVDLWWTPPGAAPCTAAQAVTVAASPGRPPYAQPHGKAMVYVEPSDLIAVIRATAQTTFQVTERDPRDPAHHPDIACSR